MDRYDYQALINEVVTQGINMFENFDDWTKGAFALSNLGENGRAMFKSISKLSSRYNEAENNRKFTNALHTNNKVSIASFIYMCHQHGIDTNRFYIKDDVDYAQPIATIVNHRQRSMTPVAVPRKYVARSLDRNLRSDFVSYLKLLVANVDQIVDIVYAYQLGVTKDGRVIYWYIDKDGIARMGKVMAYKYDGHRNKSVTPLSIPKELSKRGELSADYAIKQTLFGEHLLNLSTSEGKTIGIVESEKSAVICSLCVPDLLWMATGSKGNLQEERLSAIKEKNAILFPDTDKDGETYTQWYQRAEELNAKGWHLLTCDYLERVATTEQRLAKIDIADLLIEDIVNHRDTHSAAIADTFQGESCIRREQVYVLSDSKPMLPTDGEHSASRWSHSHI
ncbi:MAG: PriCT-2 domain-containing protein [Prevotella sp.]|nr:PriCT-2 domain-containing protein [Prevotella sp.]